MTKERKSIPKEVLRTNRRVNTPTVLQMEAVECGAASLAMVLGYYHKFLPLEVLRVDCGVSRDGSKASNVLKAARKNGLEASGFRKEPLQLLKMDLPLIIFWNFNHFVVLEGFRHGKVYINDPGEGKRIISWEEFDGSFTGVAMGFKPGADFKPSGKKTSILPLIRKRLAGSRSVLAYAVLAGLLLIVPGLIIPAFSRFFIDNVIVSSMKNLLKPLLLAMLLVAILEGVLSWLQGYFLVRLDKKTAIVSSSKFLAHLFLLPMEFFSQRMSGEITSRMQSNDAVAELLSNKLASTFISLVSVVFFGFIMFQYDALLASLCVLTLVLNILSLRLISENRKIESTKLSQEMGTLYGLSMNGIQMIETLKATGSENDFFASWSGQQAKVTRESQKMNNMNIKNGQIPQLLQSLLSVAVLSVGGLRVMQGAITMGMLVAFQALMASFTTPVLKLVEIAGDMQTAFADLRRLDDVMNYPVPVVAKASSEAADDEDIKLQGFVELKQVTFGYSKLEKPLINDFNLRIEPGKRVALVGGSGSGKSTIAKLVSGLYQPWEGEVLFDGIPASSLSRKRFTSSVSMVDQDIFIFAGTIKQNLTMWNDEIRIQDVVSAATDACVHDVIASRGDGYSGELVEGGGNYSGGQRQRLEIARALCSNPRILILDEATSALDAVTEKEVDDQIRRRGCSCLIIAHRLSTIRDCDEIIVLDHGNVVQRGTHEELISQPGLYQELVRTY